MKLFLVKMESSEKKKRTYKKDKNYDQELKL